MARAQTGKGGSGFHSGYTPGGSGVQGPGNVFRGGSRPKYRDHVQGVMAAQSKGMADQVRADQSQRHSSRGVRSAGRGAPTMGNKRGG